ncbi:hypothetical protein CPB97_004133 [Podila verticillata]|nr:hypothetical protein CPB97_004133 [Podila verticillata]
MANTRRQSPDQDDQKPIRRFPIYSRARFTRAADLTESDDDFPADEEEGASEIGASTSMPVSAATSGTFQR